MGFPRKIHHSSAKGLSLFTGAEADRCSIKRADRIYSIDELGNNSTFRFWIFKVRDSYKNHYEWRDFTLSTTATVVGIADAIKTHLTTNVDQVPYEQYIEKNEGILHTITVGDGDQGVGDTIYEALNA